MHMHDIHGLGTDSFLEDVVVTKLDWQLETRFVSEEDLGTEKVLPV